MNYSEVIKVLAVREKSMNEDDVQRILDGLWELVTLSVACGEDVHLHGFGKFEARKREPATRRNPRTGESVQVPARIAIGFKPSVRLRQRINNHEDANEVGGTVGG